MINNNDRQRKIRTALLEELANTPRGYMQPQKALAASVRLSIVPPPTEAEMDEALARLEADAMIHCEVTALGVKRWCITGIGRAALCEA